MKIVCRGIFLLAIFAAGCGETPIATSPSQSLFSQDSSGLWLGALVLTDVTGGECVGADIAAGLGEGRRLDEGTVSITQTGSDMAASVRSITTGMSCSYAGTAGTSLFGLTSVSCSEKETFFRCSNGETRVLDMVSSTMNAFSRGGETSGVVASFYNVHRADSQRTPVSGLSVRYSFEAVRP